MILWLIKINGREGVIYESRFGANIARIVYIRQTNAYICDIWKFDYTLYCYIGYDCIYIVHPSKKLLIILNAHALVDVFWQISVTSSLLFFLAACDTGESE